MRQESTWLSVRALLFTCALLVLAWIFSAGPSERLEIQPAGYVYNASAAVDYESHVW